MNGRIALFCIKDSQFRVEFREQEKEADSFTPSVALFARVFTQKERSKEGEAQESVRRTGEERNRDVLERTE